MRESRLFRIVYYLLEKEQTTAYELAGRFGVSVRTIYRDIDALSGAGIPIYAAPGRNGGIYLLNTFVLDRVFFSEEEKRDMITALQGLSAKKYVNNSNLLNKLSALFNTGAYNWLETDFSRWGNRQNVNETFELLKSAVVHHKCIRFTYAGSHEAAGESVVQPLKLMYKDAGWYLKAYCIKQQDYRIFRLSRILNLSVMDESFVPHSFPEQQDTPLREYNQIILRFPGEIVNRVYDVFDTMQVERQKNGDFIALARMPEDEWLISFLLSFGTQVDIIEPAYLKEVVARQAQLIYEKNRS